jgi:hypothetical protein
VSAVDKIAMEEDLKQLQRDIDLRNAQIADVQQNILDSDKGKPSTPYYTLLDEKQFTMQWSTLHFVAVKDKERQFYSSNM